MDVTPTPVTTVPFAPPSGQPLGSQAWGQHPRHVTPPGVPKSSLLQDEGLSTPQGDPAPPSQRRGCHRGVSPSPWWMSPARWHQDDGGSPGLSTASLTPPGPFMAIG